MDSEDGCMRVVVTGGAGYIGSALVMSLLGRGESVTSVDNLINGDYESLSRIRNDNLKLVVGDVRDGAVLDRAFEKADAVVHMAAISTLDACRERPEDAISVNVFGTKQVMDASKRNGVGKVVFCSSSAVYGTPIAMPVDEDHPLRPLNLYGVTKLASEKLVDTYHYNDGLETISLRLGNVFGLGLYTHWDGVVPKFVSQGLEGKPLTVYGDGRSSRDFVHVLDVVRAIKSAIDARGIGGEAFNVGGKTMEIGQIAELVSKELGEAAMKRPQIVHVASRAGETKDFSLDSKKIGKILGYKPAHTIEEGIRQLVKYGLEEKTAIG